MKATRSAGLEILLIVGSLAALSACADGGSGGNSATVSTALPKAWTTDQLIETDNTGTAQEPRVTTNGIGDVIAVWQQSDGSRDNVWANRYMFATKSWGVAQLIETDNAGGAFLPRAGMDTGGNTVAVWQQFDGTHMNIVANRYAAAAQAWGTAQAVENNPGFADAPQIAMSGVGNAIVVWRQFDGAQNSVWANRYVAATNLWDPAQLIETDNTGGASAPQIAVDGSGNAIVVWQQSDGVRTNIWANRYMAATDTWDIAQIIETDNAGDASGAQVAMESAGNAVAVWHQSDGSRTNIWANRYSPGTGWGVAQLIEVDNAGDADAVQVGIDSNGNAMAVWEQFDGARFNIWANRYAAGTGWGLAQLLETDNTGHAVSPEIVVDASGNAVAVWSQFDGTRFNIWANRYRAGGWSVPVLVEVDDAGSASNPHAAVNGSGEVTLVWQQSDGTVENIWSTRYQ